MAIVAQSFVGKVDGADLHFSAGQSFADDHKAVKKWPHLFKPGGEIVESATAAPGEKRSLPARVKAITKAPAKKGKAMTSLDQAPKGKAMTTSDFEPKPVPEPKVEKGENTLTTPVPTPQTDSDGVKDDAAGENDIKDK